MKIHDVVIIGAGPAGITAAIQLKRLGVEPLLLEKERAGGLLLNANLVENYPGFPDGISGVDLVGLMAEQMVRCGVRPELAEVRSLWRDGDTLHTSTRTMRRDRDTLHTKVRSIRQDAETLQDGTRSPRTDRSTFRLDADGEVLHSRFVVLASGTEGIVPDDLPLPGSLLGRRVFCELRSVSPQPGEKIAIIGGGDCAFDYALNLAGRGYRVSILHRGDRPNALPLLIERMREEPRIDYLPGVDLKEIEEGEGGLVLHLLGGPADHLDVNLLLIAVGRRPRVEFVSSGILADIDSGKEIEGLYLVGDVHRGYMRQVGIAVGDGLVAAMEIGAKLKRELDHTCE